MSTPRDPLRLADFPPASHEDWRRLVAEEMGEAALEKLEGRRVDGVARPPLAGPGDGATEPRFLGPVAVEDGGVAAPRVGARPWRIAARVDPARGLDAGTVAAAGADLLWIRVAPGEALAAADWIDATADGARAVIDAGPGTFLAAAEAVAAARDRGVDPWSAGGGFAVDPLGWLAAGGRLPGSLDDGWRQAAELAAWAGEEAPGARVVRASGRALREAGGSEVDELAFLLAAGVAWLRAAGERGLSLAAACRTLRLELAVGDDVFAEIARLRAARLLWAKVVAAAGGDAEDQRTWIDTVSTRIDRSVLDPWTNQLRSTGSAFAAILGGADSIALGPWDELDAAPTASGRRLAVDVQHVLAEEGHLGRVADPAAGSWATERLTDELARAAWKRFRELEEAGGAGRALGVGLVAAWAEEAASRRRSEVARRKLALVGVGAFADLGQDLGGLLGAGPTSADPLGRDPRSPGQMVCDVAAYGAGEGAAAASVDTPVDAESDLPSADARSAAADPSVAPSPDRALPGDLFEGAVELLGSWTGAEPGAAVDPTLRADLAASLWSGQPARAPALVPIRWAEAFERLRLRAARLGQDGEPPRAFVAAVGDAGALRARSLFVANLLAAGGIAADAPDQPFADAAAAVAAFGPSGARLAVVVTADADWPDLVPQLAPALREVGARRVVLAGRPAEPEPLRSAGVDAFAGLGGDAVALLTDLLDALGEDEGERSGPESATRAGAESGGASGGTAEGRPR